MAKPNPALEALRWVALVQAGAEVVLAVAQGTTGNEPDAACELETRFQLASVSKQFTAAALLLLADEGVLSVDEPLSRCLEDCPEAWRQVTLHQLLTQRRGDRPHRTQPRARPHRLWRLSRSRLGVPPFRPHEGGPTGAHGEATVQARALVVRVTIAKNAQAKASKSLRTCDVDGDRLSVAHLGSKHDAHQAPRRMCRLADVGDGALSVTVANDGG